MSKTKRRMKKRHEPHELNRNIHSNFYFNSLPLLYFLSTFPVCLTERVCTDALEGLYVLRQGSVRTSPRVGIDFAEGQYVLFAGSVPTAKALKGDFITQKQP